MGKSELGHLVVKMKTSNCSVLPPGYLPTTEDYFKSLETGYIVALSLCGVMAVGSVLSYLESVHFLIRNLHNWKPKDKAIWLLGLYPVLCTTSFVGLMIPRSSTLNDMVASLYLSLCVYLFVVMLMGHFGGQHKMSKRLASNQINLRSPPLCCCCLFLPQLDISTFRLRTLEITVLQFAMIRPILAYLTAVMWSDNRYEAEDLNPDSSYTWINVINIISTLFALYGFSIVYQISRVPLQKMCIKPKFLVLQLVMIISTFQHVIISVFVVAGAVPCEGELTAKANGDRWHHILFITEIFIISWFARYYYRRHVGDVPPEEQIITETQDTGSMTTGTLQRQMSENKNKYGTVLGESQEIQVTIDHHTPNGLPSISQSVPSSSGGFTDISTAITPPSSPLSTTQGANNEMDDFLNSVVTKDKKKKRAKTPVSSVFTQSNEIIDQIKQVEANEQQNKSEVVDSGDVKLDVGSQADSQSEA